MQQMTLQCTNCSTPVAENVPFCAKCGQPVLLNKRYQLVEEIGRGRGSIVYKAHDVERSHKEVAVKRFVSMNDKPQALQKAERQCKHEVEILNSLNHPHIPDVYEAFSTRDVWYLVMKFMEGETLEVRWQKARNRTRLSIEEILTIGEELCSLLDYLHQRRLVFVDLKPANVILGNDGHIDLIDFGSAYDLKTGINNKRLEQRATVGYEAPELTQGKGTTRSDIYSLGALLFQMSSREKLVSNPLPSEIVDERKLAGESPELAKLLMVMIEAEEKNRPQNVTDVQQELRRIKQKLTQPEALPQVKDSGRRSLLLGGLAGVVLSFGGGTTAWFTLLHKKVVQFPLTIGGKLDNEAALLSEMYLLLLQNDGFSMTDRSRLGQSKPVFDAMIAGTIDIYPEFLLTGLGKLAIQSTHNQQRDFQNVRDAFLNQYKIVWLNQAVNLNDNFCMAMPAKSATQLGIKTLSDLARVMANQTSAFKIAVAPDSQETLTLLQTQYKFTFAPENVIQYDEAGTFDAVKNDLAQISICYATNPLLATDNFIRLKDDKGVIQVDTPSPIIRNVILNKEPGIATTLNRLAPHLSNDVSIRLQQQVLDGQSPREVAQQWLKEEGLF